MRTCLLVPVLFLLPFTSAGANPIDGLLERIAPGAKDKFIVELSPDSVDYFELDGAGDKVAVRGNTYVNIAAGINWYLKYYAGIHLSRNNMRAEMPDTLPRVKHKERHETALALRYDFNYCTFSYTMAFWDWARWEREIDWMALHGINLPLAAVGTECVWLNLLTRLGYTREEAEQFIAGPAYLAWFEMGNLEGWGGPLPDSWFPGHEELQKRILARMREYGMEPVLPGYAGMLPHDAGERLGLDVETFGLWNGFTRPAILQATDPRFAAIADLYYEEQAKLFGTAKYYSMDPFHEVSDTTSTDFAGAGKAILAAVRRAVPDAVWVVQGWTENPRREMIDNMKNGDLLILDLFSECRPMWGMPSLWQREEGYGVHDWLFCMLENFGANVGLHGRIDQLLDNFRQTKDNPLAAHLRGIGLTAEGIENNPIMFELMCELPWRGYETEREAWIEEYVKARYGRADTTLTAAWELLGRTIYNCPRGNNQQGPHESVFCARPSLNTFQASSWSKMSNYYDPASTAEAARLFVSVADKYEGNDNFEYDLTDVLRQAVADRGRVVYNRATADYKSFDRKSFEADTALFLRLILLQDELLATRTEFRTGHWTEQARGLGESEDEANLYERNARTQITTWGNRECADSGGLRDYAHKEWSGILRDLYYRRWAEWWRMLGEVFDGGQERDIDWYAIEYDWATDTAPYTSAPEGDTIDTAKRIYKEVFGE
ncbi:MAG: alpha-N-acetylglucosaminidase [Prevotella sp.]|nr:alpha-N-acetylglucosaminidase [Prevotella sp.]